MKPLLKLCTLVAILVSIPVSSNAMASMFTAKYIDGTNIVLLTNNVHETNSGLPITYNLRIYDTEGKPISFGNAQLELLQDKHVLQSHNLRWTPNNDASIALTFPKQGTYLLKVRFLDNDKQIAQGEFPIVVSKGPNQSWTKDIFTPVTGMSFALGAGLALTLRTHGHRLFVLRKIITKK